MKNAIKKLTIIKDKEKDIKKKKELESAIKELKIGSRIIEIYPMLDNLYSNKHFIGYLCFLSQFVEFKIKYLIVKLQKLAELKNKKIKIDKDIENKPLGFLIKTLENKCINDVNLIKRLESFNELRIKSIHKLFDVDIEIKTVENEIEKLAKCYTMNKEVLDPLEKYIFVITNRIFEIKIEKGQVSDYSKSVIDRVSSKLKELKPTFKDKNAIKNIKI